MFVGMLCRLAAPFFAAFAFSVEIRPEYGMRCCGCAMLVALCLAAAVRADDAADTGVEDTVPRPEAIEPPSAAEIETAITGGIDFMLADQNANGSCERVHRRAPRSRDSRSEDAQEAPASAND